MRYKSKDDIEEIRSKMWADLLQANTGALIKVHRFWRPTEIVSYLSVMIRLFTRSFWNHTAVAVVINKVVWVLDANQNGVTLETADTWAKRHGVKVWEVTNSKKKFLAKDFLKYRGRPYDYISVFVWQPIFTITGVWLGKTGDEASKATYCTEVYSYEHGIANPERVTTGDLERMGL